MAGEGATVSIFENTGIKDASLKGSLDVMANDISDIIFHLLPDISAH